jgi:transposase
MAVAELVGREAELRPDDPPKVNLNGIEEVVADKGYHSGAVAQRVKSYGVRSYIAEKKQKGRRHWANKAEQQQAVYQNRQRVRGEYGKSLLRRRGELVERSFAHCYETGGMRRTHLRGHQNILKRQLIHVGAFNLSLILRQLMGAGTPREWTNRCELLLLVYFLLPRQEGRNWLRRSRISMSPAECLANSRSRVRRWPCRNSATYTTAC